MTKNNLEIEITYHFSRWMRTHSMFHLAKVVILAMLFMKREKFPFVKYVKNYDKQKSNS